MPALVLMLPESQCAEALCTQQDVFLCPKKTHNTRKATGQCLLTLRDQALALFR